LPVRSGKEKSQLFGLAYQRKMVADSDENSNGISKLKMSLLKDIPVSAASRQQLKVKMNLCIPRG